MNWEAIGAVGEVLGATGVIVTLAFLAYQVIQTRTAIRSSAYQSYSRNRTDMSLYLASEGVLSVFILGLNDPKSLKDSDRFIFHQVFAAFMSWLQTSHRMWQERQITDQDWESDLILVKEMKGTVAFSIWWPAVKRGFHRDFVDAVDATEAVTDLGFENFVKAIENLP